MVLKFWLTLRQSLIDWFCLWTLPLDPLLEHGLALTAVFVLPCLLPFCSMAELLDSVRRSGHMSSGDQGSTRNPLGDSPFLGPPQVPVDRGVHALGLFPPGQHQLQDHQDQLYNDGQHQHPGSFAANPGRMLAAQQQHHARDRFDGLVAGKNWEAMDEAGDRQGGCAVPIARAGGNGSGDLQLLRPSLPSLGSFGGGGGGHALRGNGDGGVMFSMMADHSDRARRPSWAPLPLTVGVEVGSGSEPAVPLWPHVD